MIDRASNPTTSSFSFSATSAPRRVSRWSPRDADADADADVAGDVAGAVGHGLEALRAREHIAHAPGAITNPSAYRPGGIANPHRA